MKFVARVIGTWLVALSVILLVIDGTKSLAVNALVSTSIGMVWSNLDATSWEAFQQLVVDSIAPYGLANLVQYALAVPAWVLSGVLGLIALVLGRKRRKPVYTDIL